MRIAVTRPAEQLTKLAARAAERDIELVPLPVIDIQPVPFQWPDGLHGSEIDWLVVTSANGVRSFFDRLRVLQVILSGRTRIASVGRKTAEAIKEYGRMASFVPSEARGEALFRDLAEQHLSPGQMVVFARAESIAFDPADMLARLGIRYVPIICYRSLWRNLPADDVRQFSAEDVILFTAPSTVRAFQEQFGFPPARVFAIGRTTAAEMDKFGWQYEVMEEANVDRVLELV